MCWNNDDIKVWKGFEGRHTYNKNQLDGRNIDIPFQMNALENNSCDLQCATGYWSNILSQYNPAKDTMMQRCTNNNCKRTFLGPIDIESTTKIATEKTEADIFVYKDTEGIIMEHEPHTVFENVLTPKIVAIKKYLMTDLAIDYRTKEVILYQ
jgi:hypothetical protein